MSLVGLCLNQLLLFFDQIDFKSLFGTNLPGGGLIGWYKGIFVIRCDSKFIIIINAEGSGIYQIIFCNTNGCVEGLENTYCLFVRKRYRHNVISIVEFPWFIQ